MISAQIVNVVREENNITVFAQFPDGVRNYQFGAGITNREIKQRIREDVNLLQKVEQEANTLKDELIGLVIE